MIVEKVIIKSNNIKYGPPPAFNDEVEQHVKICRNGRVRITRYVFGSGVRQHGYVKAAKDDYRIPEDTAAWFLDLIGGYFTEHDQEEEWFMTDVGDFRITITLEDGTKIRRKGSLGCDFEIEEEDDDLSSIIRETLGVNDLFLFDGHCGQSYIYLSVNFPGSDKEYYYRTTDKSIDVGDTILVPAGPRDRKELVRVVRKEKFYGDELPMAPEEVKSVIGKVILSRDHGENVITQEESETLNVPSGNRDIHEVDHTTADGIKFALEAPGEKKLEANVRSVPVIAVAEKYMRDFLMDRVDSDLQTYLDDFSDYLLKNRKSMQAENKEVADMIFPLWSDSDQFAALYGSEADADSVLDLKRKFWRVYQFAFMRGLIRT